jgi:hypothetical protein
LCSTTGCHNPLEELKKCAGIFVLVAADNKFKQSRRKCEQIVLKYNDNSCKYAYDDNSVVKFFASRVEVKTFGIVWSYQGQVPSLGTSEFPIQDQLNMTYSCRVSWHMP